MAIPTDPLPQLTEEFYRVVPEQCWEEGRVHMAQWMTLGLMAGADKSQKRLHEFLTVQHTITSFFEDLRLEAYKEALKTGGEMARAGMSRVVDYARLQGAREVCALLNVPVPEDWAKQIQATLDAPQPPAAVSTESVDLVH